MGLGLKRLNFPHWPCLIYFTLKPTFHMWKSRSVKLKSLLENGQARGKYLLASKYSSTSEILYHVYIHLLKRMHSLLFFPSTNTNSTEWAFKPTSTSLCPQKSKLLEGRARTFLVSYGHELVFPNTVLVIVNNLNTCPAELGSPPPTFQHTFCIYKTEIYIQRLGRCINHDAVKPEKHRPQLWTKSEKAI